MTAAEIIGREIPPDTASASCAACGVNPGGVRRQVEGKLLMLCVDACACASRYRAGRTPQQYAAALRNGVTP